MEEEKMKRKSTLKQKVLAVSLLGLSLIPLVIEKDGTFLLLMSFAAVPLLFTKQDWIF